MFVIAVILCVLVGGGRYWLCRVVAYSLVCAAGMAAVFLRPFLSYQYYFFRSKNPYRLRKQSN